MKYIKTADGWYIAKDKIDSFAVAEYFDKHGKSAGFAACAYIYGQRWRLKEFANDPKSTTHFDPEAEAYGWLDKFVAELNEAEDNV